MSSRKRLIYDSESSDSDSSDSEYDVKNDLDNYSDSDIDSDFYNEKPIKRKRVKSKIIIKPEVKRKKIEAQIKPNKRIKTEFLPFDKALVFARSLKLVSEKEWRVWRKSDARPSNVPADPSRTYKDAGWQGWGHWLGTGNQVCGAKEFLPFTEALAVARSLSLANRFEWEQWSKEGMRPPNVPAAPNKIYKDGGWQGWGHWLGTGNTKPGDVLFLLFAEALVVARSLGLAGQKEWEVWRKSGARPANMPAAPDQFYKDAGWQGWGHWLGSSGIKKASKFAPFGQAQAFARSLNLANQKEWYAWCKEGRRPPNVPSTPNKFYKDGGWQGWGHWLGTGNRSSKGKKEQFLPFDECPRATKFLEFDEALVVARSNGQAGMSCSQEWAAWCKEGMCPANVPRRPDKTYTGGGWQGWGHWLGTGNTRNTTPPLPFAEALTAARSLNLASLTEWRVWCKAGMCPSNVPSHPDRTYKDGGWQGWGHWLGTGNTRNTTPPLPFAEALTVARSLNLASSTEWKVWRKGGTRSPNVPSNPDCTYKNKGWKNWKHWLGTDIVKEKPIKIKEEPHQEPIVFNTFDEEEYKELYKWVMSKSLNVNKGASSRTRSNNIQVNKRTGELIVTCLERILNKKGLEENIRTLYEKGKKEELYSILKKIEGYLLNKESPFPSEYKEGDVIEVIEIKDYEVIDIETFVIDIMITKVIKKEKEFSIKIEKEF